MSDVTVILPVYNLQKRGLKRVMLSVYSLQKQDCDVIVVDGSSKLQYSELERILKNLNVLHYHLPLDEFNKTKLLNKGIELSKTEYIFCSDADYIFKKDLLEVCRNYRGADKMLHKKVKMLPPINLSVNRVDSWKFPNCRFNEWGTLANGAMQYATRKFFVDNPFNEEMSGFGAMDNLTSYVAYNNGLKIVWVEDSEILHQHHPIERKMSGENKIKFQRNQKILEDYRKENNLPKLLFK